MLGHGRKFQRSSEGACRFTRLFDTSFPDSGSGKSNTLLDLAIV
jgi:hypothetical protein